MTDRPKLYPNHQHQWTDADPELFTRGLVRCTVCGFQAPRNAAGLDGLVMIGPTDGIAVIGTPDPAFDDLQDSRVYDKMPIDAQPEQETPPDA